jgi:hypothetical protein
MNGVVRPSSVGMPEPPESISRSARASTPKI